MKKERRNSIVGVVACILFLAICLAGAWVCFPEGGEKNLYTISKAQFLDSTGDVWYRIPANAYKVIDRIGEQSVTDSAFRYQKEYRCYSILMTNSQGEEYVMAVRAGKKRAALDSFDSVDLYGRASVLHDDETLSRLTSGNEGYPVIHKCVNDNDDTVSGRLAKTVVFILGAVISAWILYRIIVRMS